MHHDLRNNDKSSSAGMKNDTSTSPKHALDSNIYEACDTHKVSMIMHCIGMHLYVTLQSTNRHQNSQQTQDVFDEAGFYVPTWVSYNTRLAVVFLVWIFDIMHVPLE